MCPTRRWNRVPPQKTGGREKIVLRGGNLGRLQRRSCVNRVLKDEHKFARMERNHRKVEERAVGE